MSSLSFADSQSTWHFRRSAPLTCSDGAKHRANQARKWIFSFCGRGINENARLVTRPKVLVGALDLIQAGPYTLVRPCLTAALAAKQKRHQLGRRRAAGWSGTMLTARASDDHPSGGPSSRFDDGIRADSGHRPPAASSPCAEST
jgi:hypothetical protein